MVANLREAFDDIVDFVKCRGARLLVLATPMVDDLPTDKQGTWGACFAGLRTSKNMLTYQGQGELAVNGVHLASFAKLFQQYPAAAQKLDVDLQYMVSDNEPNVCYQHDLTMNVDMTGHGVTIKRSYRVTPDGGEDGTIWCFGDSVMYGYMVVDCQTLPWQLQMLLPEKNVMNMAVLGDTLLDVAKRITTVPVRTDDTVIVQQPVAIVKAITTKWPIPMVVADVDVDEPFVDVAHMTGAAYCKTAKQLAIIISDSGHQKPQDNDLQLVHELVTRCQRIGFDNTGSVGATVMSCNPFTRGHEWLCEMGSKLFDTFLVFVMQDDLDCVFAYDDAEKLINIAVDKFANVHVVSMNGLFGYVEFWPEYITKTMKDDTHWFGIDTRRLLRCVARTFNEVNVRWFVCGDESNDVVTAQHVDSAQRVFGMHNVRTLVLPRKTFNNTNCATSVRDQLVNGDYSMLPRECVDYITTHGVKMVRANRQKLINKLASCSVNKRCMTHFLDFDDVIGDIAKRLDLVW